MLLSDARKKLSIGEERSGCLVSNGEDMAMSLGDAGSVTVPLQCFINRYVGLGVMAG